MKKYVLLLLLLTLTACSTEDHTHQWQQANYQTGETCSICGSTKGEKLTADFQRYSIDTNIRLNTEYDYSTICNDEDKTSTIGVLTFLESGLSDKQSSIDGYSWYHVKAQLTFDDDNAQQLGVQYNYFTNDYYSIENFTNTYHYDQEKQTNLFSVNYYGKIYDQCQVNCSVNKGEWVKKNADSYIRHITFSWEILLPTNYDGFVIGFRNSSVDSGKHILLHTYYDKDNFFIYRLNG